MYLHRVGLKVSYQSFEITNGEIEFVYLKFCVTLNIDSRVAFIPQIN